MSVSETNPEPKNSSSSTEQQKPPVICVFCGSSPGTSPVHLAAARSLAEALARNNARLVYGGGTVGLMGELARTLVRLSGPDAVHGVIPRALEEYEAAGRPTNDGGSRDDDNTSSSPAGAAAASTTSAGEVRNTDSNNVKSIHSSNNVNGGGVGGGEGMDETYGRSTIVKDMHARKALMAELVIEQGGPGSGFVALSGGYGTLEEVMEVTTWNQLGIHDRGVCLFNVAGYWDPLLRWIDGAVEAGFVSGGNGAIVVRADTADDVLRELRNYRPPEARFKLDWKQK